MRCNIQAKGQDQGYFCPDIRPKIVHGHDLVKRKLTLYTFLKVLFLNFISIFIFLFLFFNAILQKNMNYSEIFFQVTCKKTSRPEMKGQENIMRIFQSLFGELRESNDEKICYQYVYETL